MSLSYLMLFWYSLFLTIATILFPFFVYFSLLFFARKILMREFFYRLYWKNTILNCVFKVTLIDSFDSFVLPVYFFPTMNKKKIKKSEFVELLSSGRFKNNKNVLISNWLEFYQTIKVRGEKVKFYPFLIGSSGRIETKIYFNDTKTHEQVILKKLERKYNIAIFNRKKYVTRIRNTVRQLKQQYKKSRYRNKPNPRSFTIFESDYRKIKLEFKKKHLSRSGYYKRTVTVKGILIEFFQNFLTEEVKKEIDTILIRFDNSGNIIGEKTRILWKEEPKNKFWRRVFGIINYDLEVASLDSVKISGSSARKKLSITENLMGIDMMELSKTKTKQEDKYNFEEKTRKTEVPLKKYPNKKQIIETAFENIHCGFLEERSLKGNSTLIFEDFFFD